MQRCLQCSRRHLSVDAVHGGRCSKIFDGLHRFSLTRDPDSATESLARPMQARPTACDSDLVASVTNGALQLAWCDAAGDAIWMAGAGLACSWADAILENFQVAVLEDALRTRLRPGTIRGSTGGRDPSSG
jgi:hypothetical protein